MSAKCLLKAAARALVSGLHVPWNLWYLPEGVNQRKGNKRLTEEELKQLPGVYPKTLDPQHGADVVSADHRRLIRGESKILKARPRRR